MVVHNQSPTTVHTSFPWSPATSCDTNLLALPDDRLYEVTCGEQWERHGSREGAWVQRFAFPATPSDPLEILPVDGDPIPLEPVSAFERDRVRAFRPAEPINEACLAVTVTGQPGWYEACRDANEAATSLFVADSRVYVVEDGPAVDDVDISTVDASGSIVGCAGHLSDTLAWTQEEAERSMIAGLACSGDLAAIESADTGLAWGSSQDGGIRVFEKVRPHRWTLIRASSLDCLPTLPCIDETPAVSDVPETLIRGITMPPPGSY